MAMFVRNIILLVLITFWFASCNSTDQYKRDLLSNDVKKIAHACRKLGELNDTSAIKPLLTKALDPRMSTSLRYKGMCINYCRLIALKKISGVDIGRKIDQFEPDTAATHFYLDWAVEQGYVKYSDEVDIDYY
jgi:hypothetical protein